MYYNARQVASYNRCMMASNWQDDLTFTSQSRRRGFGHTGKQSHSLSTRIRVRIVWSVYVLGIALLLAKVIYLQAIERGQHELTAYSNHVELVREYAPRGVIYDRVGRTLVSNKVEEGKILREYPYGQATSPVLGYLSEVKNDEVGCFDGLCYQPGMIIGRAGIEQVMETTLRGRDGGRLVEVDSSGNEVRELGNNKSEAGEDLQLSIDGELQKIMYLAMEGKKGSVVALDMQGKVLGLVSSPTYDPTRVNEYLKDTEQMYFLNRPIAGTYPPGSIYKMVTGLAGLMEGKITSETKYEDTGELTVGTYRYGNWYFDQYGRKDGDVDLAFALARSNDIYFYKAGEATGVANLVKWSREFGLGEKTGIELPGERSGLVPDQLWKERVTGEKWFLGNTYHMSIGQGDLLVTPLQAARMIVGVISGRVCQVSVLRDSPVECRDLGIKTEYLDTIRAGMKAVCQPGGTAFPFFEYDPWVLCKTGTAQHADQIRSTDQDPVKPHAWMAVAYPGENPEMVLIVMLEAGGEGSADAAPIAKTILDQWRGMN